VRGKTLRLALMATLIPMALKAQQAAPPSQNAPGPAAMPAQQGTVQTPASTAGQAPQTARPTQVPPTPPVPQLPTATPPLRLTVQDAETLALKNNPQVSVFRLLALASQQATREAKSSYYPTTYGSLTGVEPREGSRIAAGNLNNPIIYERFAYGVTLGQLITDFGRTSNLVATAALQAKAADMNAQATASQIKLAVDQAFYNALQANAELKVAQETVDARQVVSDQVTTLFNNKLKSELDVSFANANLAQAKLLLLDAQNLYQAALSALSEVLGYPAQQNFELVDPAAELTPPPDAVAPLVDQAFNNRPEIAAQGYTLQASQRFHKAERDLLFPDIRALGVVGQVPTGQPQLESWYGAIGVNVNIPIFNGFLYPARSKQAALQSQADEERLRDLKNRIANDVRTTWLNTQTAYQRISVTKQFVDQTNLAVNLSQTRYSLGLASIVELSQAQLQQTEALIQFAAAKYQYQIQQAVLRFQIAAP
jgi:outer membrane protein